MKARILTPLLMYGFCLLANGCTTTEQAQAQRADLSVMEVPVIPDEFSTGQESQPSELSGEVQERGVSKIAPGAFASGMAVQGVLVTPSANAYPGELAFRTQKGYYLTAINGGGRSGDPTIITSAISAGPWEKFKLAIATPPSPDDKTVQTAATGNFVTAVNGGGMTANVLHTDATVIDQGICTYTIQTSSGFFMGIYKDPSGHMLLTTRRDGAPTANEKFQLVVYGLASPPVLQWTGTL